MPVAYSKFFAPTVLGTSAGGLYTVQNNAASNLLRGGRVRLTNTTAASATARLYAVPSGGSPGVGNAFFYDQTVPANSYVDVDVPILAVGDSLQGSASVAATINIQAIAGGIFSS